VKRLIFVRWPFRIRTRCVLWWHECGHRPRSSLGRGEEPEQPFGDVVAYATHVAEQIWPTDRAVNVGLCAGLPGLPCCAGCRRCCPAWPALLAVVPQCLASECSSFSVGILVGAAIATAGMAVLFWFASVPLGARRRVLGLVLIWIA
jgi:hypothetical protein